MNTPNTPFSWTTRVLSEVALMVQGQSPPGSTYNSQGDGLPFFQGKAEFGPMSPTAVKWCTKPSKVAQPGDVLISIRAPVGPTNLADVECCIGRGLAAIRPYDHIPPRFLLYYLQHSVSLLARQATGTTFKAISGVQLRSHPVNIPPVSEQHRIVESIESYFTRLDDTVESLERVQRNLKRYRASVLQAAVEGRLVPTEAELALTEGRDYEPASGLLKRVVAERRRRWEQTELEKMKARGKPPKDDRWKAKYKEPAASDTTGLPTLPDGWCWATLPQLGELNRGKSKHRPRNEPRLLGGPYPFIQTGEVRHSEGFITEYTATYSEFGLAQSRLWPAGTLCITIAANIADTGILKFDACFPDSIVGFLNESEPTLVRFVELFIRTAKQGLDRYAPATAQKNINLGVLSAIAVPIPPLAEQARIVTEVDRLLSVAVSTEKASEDNTLRAAQLRQSILKWAFEGKLVAQDPNDEPVAALLKRIKAEQDAARKPKAKRRATASLRSIKK